MSSPRFFVRQGQNPVLRSAAWGLLFIAGGAMWLGSVLTTDGPRAWMALLVAFLFFTPLAGGMVVWTAIVFTSRGGWAGYFERLAASGVTFAGPSLLALGALWIGSPHWAPWYGQELHQGAWMHNGPLFARDFACLAVFWVACLLYLRRRRLGQGRIAAPVLIVIYCLVFSLIGMDLAMGLDPYWTSSMFPGYFFITGLYTAVAAWAFLMAFEYHPGVNRLHDLGKLIVAFSMLSTYLMYSQILPYWYENIPVETRFLVPRMNLMPWSGVTVGLLLVVYLGPLVFMLPAWVKRSRPLLGCSALLVLLGMWAERWWLVYPTFTSKLEFGLPEVAAAAALLGALALGIEFFHRWMPVVRPEEDAR